MSSAVFFFGPYGNPLYLIDIRERDSYIVGEVVNGLWPFFYNKVTKTVYGCKTRAEATEKNICMEDIDILARIDLTKESFEQMRIEGYSPGNYNDVINWAHNKWAEQERKNG